MNFIPLLINQFYSKHNCKVNLILYYLSQNIDHNYCLINFMNFHRTQAFEIFIESFLWLLGASGNRYLDVIDFLIP